ncbi:hypothetical protein, partial [Bacillus cereus]|uniref:hypothetical protein n=1 Tax=Bacillus cereus TaxID=1396 RepID=UPI00211186A2|nr:hypothetical protein [Bacillus cereus]
GPVDDAQAVAGLSAALGVPGLLGEPDELGDELARLRAETILVPAGPAADAGEDREVLEFDPADLSVDGDLPDVEGGT